MFTRFSLHWFWNPLRRTCRDFSLHLNTTNLQGKRQNIAGTKEKELKKCILFLQLATQKTHQNEEKGKRGKRRAGATARISLTSTERTQQVNRMNKGRIRFDATVKREKEKQSARPLIANRERPALPPFRMLPSASAFCLCPYNLNRLSLSLSPFGEERK